MYSLRLFILIWSQLACDGVGIGILSASFQSSFLKHDVKLTDAFNIPMIVFLSILQLLQLFTSACFLQFNSSLRLTGRFPPTDFWERMFLEFFLLTLYIHFLPSLSTSGISFTFLFFPLDKEYQEPASAESSLPKRFFLPAYWGSSSNNNKMWSIQNSYLMDWKSFRIFFSIEARVFSQKNVSWPQFPLPSFPWCPPSLPGDLPPLHFPSEKRVELQQLCVLYMH